MIEEHRSMVPRFGETKYEVLEFVVDHWDHNRFGPTVEEIRESIGLAVRSSVQWHINGLIEDGWLTNIPKKHRSLQPTKRGKRLVRVLREISE